MSKCLPCSKVSGQELDTVKYYKSIYKSKGHVFYVYRLSKNSSFLFTGKQDFKVIFERDIKPNIENGAEYFHIAEFKG